MRLLEAGARAESNWARGPNHGTRPSDWRQLGIYWAQVTGPDCTITGQAQVIGAIPVHWAGHVAQKLAILDNFQNCTDFRKQRRFPKTKMCRFLKTT